MKMKETTRNNTFTSTVDPWKISQMKKKKRKVKVDANNDDDDNNNPPPLKSQQRVDDDVDNDDANPIHDHPIEDSNDLDAYAAAAEDNNNNNNFATLTRNQNQSIHSRKRRRVNNSNNNNNNNNNNTNNNNNNNNVDTNQSLLVEHVFAFLNHSSSTSTTITPMTTEIPTSSASPVVTGEDPEEEEETVVIVGGGGGGGGEIRNLKSISYLVDFLTANDDNFDEINHPIHHHHHQQQQHHQQQCVPNHGSITKKDVASILLPWSISRLLARCSKMIIEDSMDDYPTSPTALDRKDQKINEIEDCSEVNYDGRDGRDGRDDGSDTEASDEDFILHALEWDALSQCLNCFDGIPLPTPVSRTAPPSNSTTIPPTTTVLSSISHVHPTTRKIHHDDYDVEEKEEVVINKRTTTAKENEGTTITTSSPLSSSSSSSLSPSSSTSFISSCLSQNTLNRLLPYVVHMALKSKNNTREEQQREKKDVPQKRTSQGVRMRTRLRRRRRMAIAATNIYIHLVQNGKYYRPKTLDVACSTLLVLVDEHSHRFGRHYDSFLPIIISSSVSSCWPYNNDWEKIECIHRVRMATLSMIHRLVDTITNYKRIFVILSSSKVLPILGRWILPRMLSLPYDSDKRQQQQQQQVSSIVADILQKGLYNRNISMDGYRSAIHHLDLEVRAAEKKHTREGDEIMTRSSPKNGDEDVTLTTLSSKLDNKWICFQSSLFATIRSLFGGCDTVWSISSDPPLPSPPSQQQQHVMIHSMGILPLITRGFFERVLSPRRTHLLYPQQQSKLCQQENVPKVTAKAKASTTTIEADAILQFRFWRHVISPVVDQLSFLSTGNNLSKDPKRYQMHALLSTLSQMLELLLKYDAYSPSYTDVDEECLIFMKRVTNGLFCCCTHQMMNKKHNDNDLCANEDSTDALILSSFNCILSLNHRLIHEQLSILVHFVCYCLPVSSSLNATLKNKGQVANGVLSKIVKTYRELRQVEHFIASMRRSFVLTNTDASESEDDPPQPWIDKTMMVLKSVSFANIRQELAWAYQMCPSGQIRDIWNFFNDWVLASFDACSRIEGEVESVSEEAYCYTQSSCMAEHTFAVQMFILFIENIRVAKQNATELRSLCETTASLSVSRLLSGSNSGLPFFERAGLARAHGNVLICLRNGFDLCSSLVDLHTRGRFWMDGGDIDDESRGAFHLLSHSSNDCSNEILSFLRNLAMSTLSTKQFQLWRSTGVANYLYSATLDCTVRSSDTISAKSDTSKRCNERIPREEMHDVSIPPSLHSSLLRLALHRVHQLHSMIYYCKMRESELHISDDDMKVVHNTSSSASLNEAKMLVDFSIYLACGQLMVQCSSAMVGELSSESLWIPLAESISIWTRYSDAFHIELFLIWFFGSFSQICCRGNRTELVSGHENRIVLSLSRDASFYDLGNVMTSFTRVGVQYAISQFLDGIVFTNSSKEKIVLDLSFTSIQLFEELAEKEKIKAVRDHNLDSVSTTLALLASAPIELTLCNEHVELIIGIMKMNAFSSQVIKHGMNTTPFISQKLRYIICLNNNIVSHLLSKVYLSSFDFDSLYNVPRLLFNNCVDFRLEENIVSASCMAISEYFNLCIDHYDKNDNALLGMLTLLGNLVQDMNIDFAPKATFVRAVIRRMNILNRQHSIPLRSTQTNQSAYSLCLQFALESQNILQPMSLQHISMAGRGEGTDAVAANALLLESELGSLIGNHIVGMPDSNLIKDDQVKNTMSSVSTLFSSVLRAQESSCGVMFTKATEYFLSVMAVIPGFFLQCVPMPELLDMILKAFEKSVSDVRREYTCLEAALCSIIRSPGVKPTKIVVDHLLSKLKECSTADYVFITKAFHLLILSANSSDQNNYLSESCTTFLVTSVGLLRGMELPITEVASHVCLFSKTLTTLISKKELLLLTGREISIICCEMNPVLADTRDRKYDDDEAGVSVFISCCSIITSLIAHYPKQLYGCPSPLFSVMLALLSNVLQTKRKGSITSKAYEYAKVCELLIPHKDVFKKHVVGLVLQFISSMKIGCNTTVKSKLMPSVFALLDMLSDFETRQINAMIDVPSKTLFAPVFHSYQKHYQYHGQA